MRGEEIKTVQIIVGENSHYPNGKKFEFEKMGFSELDVLGGIYLLNRGCDRIYKLGITL